MLEGAIIGLLVWLIQYTRFMDKKVGDLTEAQKTILQKGVTQYNSMPRNANKQTTEELHLLSIQKQAKIGWIVLPILVAIWILAVILVYPALFANL